MPPACASLPVGSAEVRPCRPSRGLRCLAVLTLASLAGALTGCFGGKNPDAHCDDPAEYQASTSVPAIQAPDGLTAPGKASGYSVPGSPDTAEVRGSACLARPPDYFREDPGVAPTPAPAPAPARTPGQPPAK